MTTEHMLRSVSRHGHVGAGIKGSAALLGDIRIVANRPTGKLVVIVMVVTSRVVAASTWAVYPPCFSPGATTHSAPSGNGDCNAAASIYGIDIHASISALVVKTCIAVG